MTYNPVQVAGLGQSRSDRPSSLVRMSAHEAKQEALYLVRSGRLDSRHGKRRPVLDLLSTTGVLLEEQLMKLAKVGLRSLRRYRNQGLIDVLPTPPKLGVVLGRSDLRVYALGPVGLAVAELLQELVPTGYLEAKTDRVTHDVLCNLVCYGVYQAVTVPNLGYEVIFHSKYEATVHDKEGRPLLEPDAMLVLKHPHKASELLLVEYHNEESGGRVAGKVRKYEEILKEQPEQWQRAWGTTEWPKVLAVWTHQAVGTAYVEFMKQRREVNRNPVQYPFLGKPLSAFIHKESALLWHDLNQDQPNSRLLRGTAHKGQAS